MIHDLLSILIDTCWQKHRKPAHMSSNETFWLPNKSLVWGHVDTGTPHKAEMKIHLRSFMSSCDPMWPDVSQCFAWFFTIFCQGLGPWWGWRFLEVHDAELPLWYFLGSQDHPRFASAYSESTPSTGPSFVIFYLQGAEKPAARATTFLKPPQSSTPKTSCHVRVEHCAT